VVEDAEDGSPCTSNDVCIVQESCSDGECVGAPRECS